MRIFYLANRDEFKIYLTKIRAISEVKVKDYVSGLDRKLIDINNTKELQTHLSEAYTDAYGRALKNLFNFMEFKEYEHFNDITIERWRKAIKLRRSGVREIYVSDSEIQTAYENIRESVKPLFKLLVYSGVRLSQALEGIKQLDNVVVKEDVARIPVNSISKGNKKVYWIYFPSTFLGELKQFDTSHNRHTYQKWIKFNRVSASTLRKWNLNFMIEHGIPESVSDFIQGRASVTVGSAHYLAKTNQADLWYSKILPTLVDILP